MNYWKNVWSHNWCPLRGNNVTAIIIWTLNPRIFDDVQGAQKRRRNMASKEECCADRVGRQGKQPSSRESKRKDTWIKETYSFPSTPGPEQRRDACCLPPIVQVNGNFKRFAYAKLQQKHAAEIEADLQSHFKQDDENPALKSANREE